MNKKIFLTFRTLFYIFLALLLFKEIFNNLTTYEYSLSLPFSRFFLYYLPPIFSLDFPSFSLPIWINILFILNILILIFSPLFSLKLNNLILSKILTLYTIAIDFFTLIILFINFKLIEIDKIKFLPISQYYYYNLTFILFFITFFVFLNNIYSNLKKLKMLKKKS